MRFIEFSDKIKNQFNQMQETGKLFRVNISGQELWDIYLSSFRPEDNPVFRDPDSSKHNGNLGKSFIRRYGNVVTINGDYGIVSMFDIILPNDCEYYLPCKALRDKIKESSVRDVFFETFDELNSLPYERCTKSQSSYKLGVSENHKIYTVEEAQKFGKVEAGKTYKFNHFNADLKTNFVDKSGKSVEAIMSNYRDAKNVFQRGLEEIHLDTLILVRDLINQGSLLNGEAYLEKLKSFLENKIAYDNADNSILNNWCWINSYEYQYAKFKNELIGVLCSDLSEGVELNKACLDWNKRVDPANYMKATAPITKTQIKEAQKFVEENGYEESFNRRFATKDDINISEIVHSSLADSKDKKASIFDNVTPSKSTRHKKSQLDNVEEVSVNKFMDDILPSCNSVELFFENRMEGNLVTLTTSENKESKKAFKWDNNFSWTYKGNLAGKSLIKEAVSSQGGKVDGVLRFSIMWSEGVSNDNSDLDAHCIEPDGNVIYYSNSISRKTKGNLDIDITQPLGHKNRNKEVVENITYPVLSSMQDGIYRFRVNQFAERGSEGFKAEIEFNGEMFNYEVTKPVFNRQFVEVAEVTLNNGVFTIKHLLPELNSSKKIWNIETNSFQRVNLICLSPNYWGNNNTGNKHYLFMVDNCYSDESIRSFHNENLNTDLLSHRKVLEVLGQTTKLEPQKNQIAGLGFNSTVRDELIVRVKGSFKRTLKIKF